MGSNGRRQSASRSVRVACLYGQRLVCLHSLSVGIQNVCLGVAVEMSALYQNGASCFVAYLASSTIHVVNSLNLYARQDFGFWHVGRQE